jgi:hypothetical protein
MACVRLITAVFLVLLLAASALAAPAAEETSASARAAIESAIGAILQGNGVQARRIMAKIPDAELGGQAAQLLACVRSRLDEPPAATEIISPETHKGDPFAARLLQLYREYWRESLDGQAARQPVQEKLLQGLAVLLQKPRLASIDEADPLVAARLAGAGIHSLGGVTGLLHDLMLWTQQKEQMETVALPEGTTTTKVFYLDGFVSRGWSSYLMCDKTGTGGWAKPEGLYVVVPGYESLSDETFRVSFLAHESQHYSDYVRFPGLAGWELEYRAKLVELVYANATRNKVLSYFISSQGDDPADAHSYANRRVLAGLRARLGVATDAALSSVAVETLQHAALEELRGDTDRRSHGAPH